MQDRERSGERRAEKLRQVRRRLTQGASTVRRMSPVKRAAHVARQRRRQQP
jgi:hypothetical protein